MVNAQHDLAMRPRNRIWIKVISVVLVVALVLSFAVVYRLGEIIQKGKSQQRASDANAPACAAQVPETTLANDAPHVGDCVTYTPQNSDTEATTDRFADVADLLAGTADSIHSPDDQIRSSQALVAANKLTLDETWHQEDIIAASLIFTATKETLPGVSDDEILEDMRTIPHLQITREDVGAKLVIAHAGLLATDTQETSDALNVVDNAAAVDAASTGE